MQQAQIVIDHLQPCVTANPKALGWFTKKKPTVPKYSVFPALFEINMGLVGGLLGGPIHMQN